MFCNHFLMCFFFKQKTAYELRISDWSSDVCASDLYAIGASAWRIDNDFFFERIDADRWRWREVGCELDLPLPALAAPVQLRNAATAIAALRALDATIPDAAWAEEIGRAHV